MGVGGEDSGGGGWGVGEERGDYRWGQETIGGKYHLRAGNIRARRMDGRNRPNRSVAGGRKLTGVQLGRGADQVEWSGLHTGGECARLVWDSTMELIWREAGEDK